MWPPCPTEKSLFGGEVKTCCRLPLRYALAHDGSRKPKLPSMVIGAESVSDSHGRPRFWMNTTSPSANASTGELVPWNPLEERKLPVTDTAPAATAKRARPSGWRTTLFEM